MRQKKNVQVFCAVERPRKFCRIIAAVIARKFTQLCHADHRSAFIA
jgi:hypothetical protein